MWYREFKDYPPDTPLKKAQVEPGHGIIGCEMHEMNGWGLSFHQPKKKKRRGLIATLVSSFFSKSNGNE
ncbi:MAG: hypothetical protein ACSNEK_00940 [Parachlamydiaceae bacterium]